MKKYRKYFSFYIIIKLFILLNSFNFYFLIEINITRPLGGEGFRYVRFSFNSEGDMILDTSSNPGTKERIFYGLKNNGKYYFKYSNGTETPYKYMYINNNDDRKDVQRFEGESIFIKLKTDDPNTSGKEYILGTAKKEEKYESYCELYFFEEENILYDETMSLFGEINSDIYSAVKLAEDTDGNFNYVFSFIRGDHVIIKNIYFDSSKNYYYKSKDIESIKCSKRIMVSSFYTKNSKFIIFIHHGKHYRIIAYNKEFKQKEDTEICESREYKDEDKTIFFKGIHFKEEIGAFLYFKTIDNLKPEFTLLKCKDDNKMEKFINNNNGKYIFKKDFNNNAKMNDLIKINDNQIGYISISDDKKILNIVIFIYFEAEDLFVRYYEINMLETYQFKFYNEIVAASYNGFISIGFSHCPENYYDESQHAYSSSLIIFNYPNSDNDYVDLINELNITNENISEYSFNLDNKTFVLENNIFGYIYKGVQIIGFPNDI